MTKVTKRLLPVFAALILTLGAAGGAVAAQQPPPPPRVETYVPVDSLPPQEQMPAAPLLVGAYSFVLVALFVYLVSVARRTQHVQREIERLERDLKKPGLG